VSDSRLRKIPAIGDDTSSRGARISLREALREAQYANARDTTKVEMRRPYDFSRGKRNRRAGRAARDQGPRSEADDDLPPLSRAPLRELNVASGISTIVPVSF
jgi:hypothetical protein